jgi:hypothetical protein
MLRPPPITFAFPAEPKWVTPAAVTPLTASASGPSQNGSSK